LMILSTASPVQMSDVGDTVQLRSLSSFNTYDVCVLSNESVDSR
jgi:hypothetical protein